MLQKIIIEHCAPTLAGLKTGEIVNYRVKDIEQAKEEARALSRELGKKGVTIEILCQEENRLLLYVYREKRLARDLSCPVAREFLKKQGYVPEDIKGTVQALRERVGKNPAREGFPHEIGLFLSYPAHDVKGFIENGGRNCKHCGYWKVYGEKEKAISLFAKFDKCKAVYRQMCSRGVNIDKLTVAC